MARQHLKNRKPWQSKSGDAGRGNAHERACKYYTPGLLKIGRQIGNQPDYVSPYCLIFSGGIATDKKRIEEIEYWFQGDNSLFLMWNNLADRSVIINHFENHLKQKLL